MRSIFAKIVLWFVVTTFVSFAAFVLTTIFLLNRDPKPGDAAPGFVAMQFEDARMAYDSGGKPALEKYFLRLDKYFPAPRFMLDRSGVDLITGKDLSRDFGRTSPQSWWPTRHRFVLTSADGRYRFITTPHRPPDVWPYLPYYLWIFFAVALLCYGFSVNLVTPLRVIRNAVERFGQGELSERLNSRRKDEFGAVALAFDQMANRIQTLVSAERRLLQDISHELRSPLARLGFSIELARTSANPQASLNRIRKEADRLNELVSTLLEVTRAEGDPAARQMQTVNVTQLVESLIESCQIEAEARECWFRFQGRNEVTLRGDGELLRRAIENIVRNAIRYAPNGTAIDVDLGASKGVASVAVRDYGSGVPEESLKDIFKPFFRVEAARDRNSGGVGLGLAIAKRAVELHNGELKARNAGPGLLVEIELPVMQALKQRAS